MAKKHKHAEHENHERWLVSYADFITLLFAFFVVMYSVSSLNEGKYRVLSESMVAAFRASARTLQPVQVGNLARSPHSPVQTFMNIPKPMPFNPAVIDEQIFEQDSDSLRAMKVDEDAWAMDQASQQMEQISQEVAGALDEMIQSELVTVRKNRLWVEVELNSNFLFASGSAVPSIDAEIILMQLSKVLTSHSNQLQVEGFTDNKPITNSAYPSNWELSSARAAAVVRLFAQFGVQPERMAAVGHGEFRPVASNETETGRARNRRVVIVIVANLENQMVEASTHDFELLQQELRSMPTNVN